MSDADGDGGADDDDCVEYDACGICNGPGQATSAGVRTFPPASAIAMESADAVARAGKLLADSDQNGLCDADEGCTTPWPSTTIPQRASTTGLASSP